MYASLFGPGINNREARKATAATYACRNNTAFDELPPVFGREGQEERNFELPAIMFADELSL